MKKKLGIDLGTNSIGLTLREGNEFNWYGVYTFKKGVGQDKSGEFSLAAERTKHRSPRRLYNARRYRKWETLKALIENDYCPLTREELNKWKHYEKGKGRQYPIHNTLFNNWIKLDLNNDGKPDYISPYQLRKDLIENKLDLNKKNDRYKIGRAFYHIAQRRGFKSSRKNGDKELSSVYKGSNETKTIGVDKYQDLIDKYGTLGAAFANLELEGIRIRNRYTLRKHYEEEIKKIIEYQGIDKIFAEKIIKAIFFQRPLRSQKGLVGKCSLEKNKYRCPVSHPKFEQFRAWSFINNIKYKVRENETFKSIPLDLKNEIYQKLFLREKDNFKFSDIKKLIVKDQRYNWQLNYKDKTVVSGCPVSAKFKVIFGENWDQITIINNKKEYDINDIWHILFSFDDEEYFIEFIKDKLGLKNEQIKKMHTLFNKFPVGYGNLSLKAINNILPFLKEGLIYSEAVLLAKVPEIIGKTIFLENKNLIIENLKAEIETNRREKQIIYLTNTLISNYFVFLEEDNNSENLHIRRAKGVDEHIKEISKKEVKTVLINYFGRKKWDEKSDEEKTSIYEAVLNKYLKFLDGKQENIEKASYSVSNNPEIDYYKMPKLSEQIKNFLYDNFEIEKNQLKKLYHPSQIDIYPHKENIEKLGSPKTRAFKNPMAYKTLYKLRKVLNNLIETGKIDSQTKIVIEIAREMNDKNMRKAIEVYQRRRERENESYAKAISELIKEPEFKGTANPDNEIDKRKFRIWTEQIEDFDNISNEIVKIENEKSLKPIEKDIKKYRLWKEQNAICMYTGKIIKLTDLFNDNIIDFEHTLPRSKSLDNSLENLTVCYADYNRNIKKNKIPTELPNYNKNWGNYSAIKPRLEKWKKRIDELEKQIENLKFKSKIAIDKDQKDKAIKDKHLKKFEYDYWKNKVSRFEMENITSGFVRSQLTDTQLISKYAYHYLKTYFNSVEVQKGNVTAIFRKIYGIQEKYKKKERIKHFHHAIDAAVLTLIPSSSKKEEILKKNFEYEETFHQQYHEKPFEGFHIKMIHQIEKELLINNMPDRDRALQETKRKVRKRGKIVWLRDKNGKYILDDNGNKIPKIAQGDTMRGQLHKESFFGAIKVVKRDKNNKPLRKEDGSWDIIEKNEGLRFVKRIPVEEVTDLNKIVDPDLAEMIKKQMNGKTLKKTLAEGVYMLDKNGNKINKIRRVRCWVRSTNPLRIKQQTYPSKYEYKNYYYADTGDNYAFGLYVEDDKPYDTAQKKIIPINLFEASKFKKENKKLKINDLFEEYILIGRGKKKQKASLYHIFQPGQKVIFYTESKDELKDLGNLTDRLYKVKNLFDAKQGLIQFQHHAEARNDEQLTIDFPKKDFGQRGKNGFSKFSTDFIQPRLLLSPGNLKCIIENKNFIMKLDGTIKFLY